MRTQLTFLVSSIFKQWNVSERNNLQGMKPTWIEWDKAGDSTAQLPRYKLLCHCPSHKCCHVVCKSFRKSFNFSPGPTAESHCHNFNWIYFILFAMAPDALWLLELVQCSAWAQSDCISLYKTAIWRWLTCLVGVRLSKPADSDSDRGRIVSLSDLVLNLTF